MKFSHLLFVISHFLAAYFTFGLDLEVADDGSAFLSPTETPTAQVSATFYNHYLNDALTLYWRGEDGEEVVIGEIGPSSSMGVNTFNYHTFLARNTETNLLADPKSIQVIPGKNNYIFQPPKATAAPSVVPKPFIRTLNVRSTSASAKFRNLVPETVDVWYDDGRDGLFQGSLELGKEYTVNSYDGHVFYFTRQGDKSKEFARHVVSGDKVLYIVMDPTNPPPQHMLEHKEKEEAFMREYLERTGIQWRHYFGPDGPRGPPSLHMWPAKYVGQTHQVTTPEGYWNCLGDASCQSATPNNITLEVISTHPKAFLLRNFLNEIETDAIIATAAPKMDNSYVGNKDGGGARRSDTRTSRNTWLPRHTNSITETLFKRAEAALNITRLDYRNTEDMQVVHYINGQKYDNHHDWGVSGYPESRYITLLLYLTDMVSPDAGCETSFPKGNNGLGLKIHPGKGSAVLFYNLLEDGNGDDLSLHAALPCTKGEKWLANFWVWDPKRK